MHVKVNYKNISNLVTYDELLKTLPKVEEAHKTLINKSGAGNDFLGWVDWPLNYDKEEYDRIKKAAEKIRKDSDVLVVIGIGGSYLGAKAVIEAMKEYFTTEKQVEIIFAGHTLSSTYTAQLLKYLENKEFSINVISKSGTTTEPAVAFRVFKELLIKKYGEKEAASRIYATTDKAKGALRVLSTNEGYETFIVPDDIGGRYSWFTAVGLLPIAAAGINIDDLMKGATLAREDAINKPFEENSALVYAACRNALYNKGLDVEILVSYEPKLSYISEWWKQLYGESEGKDGKGVFPASLVYSTDLHSMGQYVQEGKRIMFETVLNVETPEENIILKKEAVDLDQLNYLEGKDLDSVNKMAMQGTILAHVDGGVPNLVLSIEKITAENIGYLLYFYMFSCGVCCYMTDVNPFNQPGVESYKKNMFALLEKPGFEAMTEELKKRL
jgi:glucose-6-phosphate isomerase